MQNWNDFSGSCSRVVETARHLIRCGGYFGAILVPLINTVILHDLLSGVILDFGCWLTQFCKQNAFKISPKNQHCMNIAADSCVNMAVIYAVEEYVVILYALHWHNMPLQCFVLLVGLQNPPVQCRNALTSSVTTSRRSLG